MQLPINLKVLSLFDLILYVLSAIFQLNRDGSAWVEPVLQHVQKTRYLVFAKLLEQPINVYTSTTCTDLDGGPGSMEQGAIGFIRFMVQQ